MRDFDYMLLFVDPQIGFMRPDGNLPANEGKGAMNIVDQALEADRIAREYGFARMFSGDYHGENADEFPSEGQEPDPENGIYPVHCRIGTEDARFVEPLRPAAENRIEFDWRKEYDFEEKLGGYTPEQAIVAYKDHFNLFSPETHAKEIVNYIDPNEGVVLGGVTTEVCVNQAALGFLERDYDVAIIESAIEGIKPENAEQTKEKWRETEGITLLDNTYQLQKYVNDDL